MKLIKLWEADFDRAYELQNTFVQDENGFINAAYGFSREKFQEYVKLRKQNSEGVNLPEGFVPDTVYLLETEGEYVGIFNLRHRLTEGLVHGAGHIGYGISPKYREKGMQQKVWKCCWKLQEKSCLRRKSIFRYIKIIWLP